MILRNLSSEVHVLLDKGALKTVRPNSLVQVSEEAGINALANAPSVWVVEQAIVPPPPPTTTPR